MSEHLARNIFVSTVAAGALLAPTAAYAADAPEPRGGTVHQPFDLAPDLNVPSEGTIFMPVSIDVTAAEQDDIVRPYAPDFKDVTPVTPENTAPVKAWLSKLAIKGLANPVITVTGSASGEDSHIAADAGLSTKSEANHKLAVERAENIAAALRKELKDDAQPRIFEDREIPVKVAGGTEQVLSEYELGNMQEFAEQNGYNTIRDMVVDYNKGRGRAMDPHVNDYLYKILNTARGAHVVISGEIPVPVPSVMDAPKEKIIEDEKPFTQTVEDTLGNEAWLAAMTGLTAAGLAASAVSHMFRRRKDDSWVVVPVTADNMPAPHREEFDVVND